VQVFLLAVRHSASLPHLIFRLPPSCTLTLHLESLVIDSASDHSHTDGQH